MTPEEEVICPSVATKPVLQTIGQQINKQKAHDLMANIKPEGMNGAVVEAEVKPPRPPPAASKPTVSEKKRRTKYLKPIKIKPQQQNKNINFVFFFHHQNSTMQRFISHAHSLNDLNWNCNFVV